MQTEKPPGKHSLVHIKLQKLGPGDDPEGFLYTFERIATAAKWLLDQWALFIMAYLTGLAQVVDTMELMEMQDYAKVKAAILGTLDLSEEVYRHRF